MKKSRPLAMTLGLALACAGANSAANEHSSHAFYTAHNLVSDGTVAADHVDPNLINAWGVAFNPFGFVWVANNATGTSTLYDGAGVAQSLIVQIPTVTTTGGGPVTGIVYNGSSGFVVKNATTSGASRFLFATEGGVIAGWAPTVDTTHAIRAVDSSAGGAIYKGLALSAGGSGQLLYATDFHNARIDVFDATFAPVTLPAGRFTDPKIPSDYAPFGIQAINGDIYVTYAKQDADKHDNVNGQGLGYVDVYDPNGVLLDRVAARGALNAPWGIALAPAGFGAFSNSLLIGNFGDGRINAFSLKNYSFRGNLRGQDNRSIVIDGLWGLAFGNGFANQPVNTLFFAAGPNDEANGLYGRIDASALSGGDDSDD
ncbi:MAG: TIGR03118 family protein [Rudaea sp.]